MQRLKRLTRALSTPHGAYVSVSMVVGFSAAGIRYVTFDDKGTDSKLRSSLACGCWVAVGWPLMAVGASWTCGWLTVIYGGLIPIQVDEWFEKRREAKRKARQCGEQ